MAALNNMEMLPWDVWGAMPEPGEPISDDSLALFDSLAALTADPDLPRPQLAEVYESDDRLRVPGTVFNAVRTHPERWHRLTGQSAVVAAPRRAVARGRRPPVTPRRERPAERRAAPVGADPAHSPG